LVLLVHLPPRPVGLRVKVWRRLRAIGAVALKPSAYLLPDVPEQREHFEWLAQEIENEGGQATLLPVEQIERFKPEDLKRLFQDARGREYAELAGEHRALLQRAAKADPRARARLETRRRRLAAELQRIRAIDFFDTPLYRDVKRLEETLAMQLRHSEAPARKQAALDPKRYRGKRWVTRLRPHVDRIATAWLIRRFIDPKAHFGFAPPDAFPKRAIPFDAPGAEFGHQGADCTFETVLKRFGLTDPRLAEIAQMVHDVDLQDDRFARAEARGLDLVLRGLLAATRDDREVLERGMAMFDGLYAALGGRGRRAGERR
jgi:hypothetical protein